MTSSPGLHEREDRGEDRLRRAGGDRDLGRRVVAAAVQRLDLGGDRLAQRRHAGHRRVLVVAGAHRRVDGVEQLRIAVEIGEALAEVDRASFSAASADITVKIVVPTAAGGLVCGRGAACGRGRSTVRGSQFVVVGVAGSWPARPAAAVEPVGSQLGERVDEVAQVGAALEGDAGDVLAEQVADRPRDQVARSGRRRAPPSRRRCRRPGPRRT